MSSAYKIPHVSVGKTIRKKQILLLMDTTE